MQWVEDLLENRKIGRKSPFKNFLLGRRRYENPTLT
jgi:hypothetical protein